MSGNLELDRLEAEIDFRRQLEGARWIVLGMERKRYQYRKDGDDQLHGTVPLFLCEISILGFILKLVNDPDTGKFQEYYPVAAGAGEKVESISGQRSGWSRYGIFGILGHHCDLYLSTGTHGSRAPGLAGVCARDLELAMGADRPGRPAPLFRESLAAKYGGL